MFLRQSLLEMLNLFAMYMVHLGIGHTLLHFTIKEGTIRKYLNEAGKVIKAGQQVVRGHLVVLSVSARPAAVQDSGQQMYKMQNPNAQIKV
jgi:hypothetical protein